MICFQSIIFDILKTTHAVEPIRRYRCDLLSIYYLWHTENNGRPAAWRASRSCDLLSIYYLWHTENNRNQSNAYMRKLWFAFNLLSLTYWKQLSYEELADSIGCDLLSIYYLWHTENNQSILHSHLWLVVICFQSIIFDILKTTPIPFLRKKSELWFAFNLLSLTSWKQLFCILCRCIGVVICFQSIIFDILKTTKGGLGGVNT